MYEFREINNKEVWEEFIKNQSGKITCPTSFIQSWNWGEFLKKQNQKIFRFGIYEDSSLIGLALGTKVPAKRGPYLHFRHGPVINWENKELVDFTINELKDLGKRESVWFVRISPLVEYASLPDALEENSSPSQMHDVDAEETWVLDLDKNEEELLTQMRKNTRYSIRKAEKMGIEIVKTTDVEMLKEFWPIYEDTVKRQKWTAYDFETIKNEFEIFTKDKQDLLILARHQGRFIAAAIFNYYNGQSVYRHSGSLTEYRNVPASYLVQWEAIKESINRGMDKHNFWGVPLNNTNELDTDHPWSGLGLFKVGFGGHAERWIHARDIPVSSLFHLTHVYEKLEKFRRGYK